MGHYLEGHSTSPRVMIPATCAFHQTARSGAHGFRSHRLRSCCASIVGLGPIVSPVLGKVCAWLSICLELSSLSRLWLLGSISRAFFNSDSAARVIAACSITFARFDVRIRDRSDGKVPQC